MNFWTVAWIVWLLAFLAIELPAALAKGKGSETSTLSEHIWKWFRVKSEPKGWRRSVLLGLLLVLVYHLVVG